VISIYRWLLAASLALGLYASAEQEVAAAQPSDSIVCAVLFYSPTCSHCHEVINGTLPLLLEKYGDQLQILTVDISQPEGQTLFMNALASFGLERDGVPFLVIGDSYLVGSIDIPKKFPGLIEQHLAQGGIGWPAIPGLAEAINLSSSVAALATPAPTLDPEAFLAGELESASGNSIAYDPAGNTLAIIFLFVMIISAGGGLFFMPVLKAPSARFWMWATPILSIIELGVAGYLSYVEVTQVEAVCGPVGDCNVVQQSEYALLFGVLPVGVLGLAGYVAILIAWVVGHYGQGMLADLATAAILGMTTFGILFSIYLTFLEPFVIGATCAWCLTSAVLMTMLFLLSLAPGRLALSSLFQGNKQVLN